MSKLFQMAAMILALTFFSSAYAADMTTVNADVQSFMQELEQKNINLTPEQKKSMESIMVDSVSARENVIKSHQGEKGVAVKKQMRNELQTINDKTQAEVKKVLNDQQYQAFLQVQEARQAKLRERINSEF